MECVFKDRVMTKGGGNDVALRANDVALRANDVAVRANDVALRASDVALRANDVALRANDVALRANDVERRGRIDAVAYLEGIKKLDELISLKLQERIRLVRLAEDISPPKLDGIPYSYTGSVPKKVENAVIELVLLTEELEKSIAEFHRARTAAISLLESLPIREYGALHRHYIQYKPWEVVAEEMGYSDRHIRRIRNMGIKMVEERLTR